MPTTKWAQSAEDVHVWVKFAHKLDTPAQVNSKAHPATFTNTSLAFNASNPNKVFRLDLTLFAAIDPAAAVYTRRPGQPSGFPARQRTPSAVAHSLPAHECRRLL